MLFYCCYFLNIVACKFSHNAQPPLFTFIPFDCILLWKFTTFLVDFVDIFNSRAYWQLYFIHCIAVRRTYRHTRQRRRKYFAGIFGIFSHFFLRVRISMHSVRATIYLLRCYNFLYVIFFAVRYNKYT